MATKSVQVDTGAAAQLGMDGVEQVTAPNLVLTDMPRPNPNSPQDPPPQPAKHRLLPLSCVLHEGLLQGHSRALLRYLSVAPGAGC